MKSNIIAVFTLASLTFLLRLNHGYATEDMVVHLLTPQTVNQGEPLSLTVKIQNMSKAERSIYIPVVRRFGPDTVSFNIQFPNSTTMQSVQRPDIYVGGMKIMPPSPLPIKKLSPGEVVKYSFALVYEFPDVKTRKWLFDQLGEYTLQATVYELVDHENDSSEVPYDSPRHAIMSKTSVVEIVSPITQRDKDALHALWSLSDEYLIYEPTVYRSDCHASAIESLMEYFSHYRDTNLGRRAALPLGIAVAEGLIRDDTGIIKETIEILSQSVQPHLSAMASEILKNMELRRR